MKHLQLFEEFKIKPRAVDIPVYSTGQRPVNIDNQKVVRKQDVIIATNKTIYQIVRDEIERLGKNVDLNHIDVSQVNDMTGLFYKTDFQGDISQWDVSNVRDMDDMFYDCENFNCDISNWKVDKVEYMVRMFSGCKNFNRDISNWNVINVKSNSWIFYECPIKEEYKPKFK